MVVHAHPDDESITTGGLLARCASAGVRTCVVTCTDGRYGPVNPELGVALSPDQLAVAHAAELEAAAAELDVDELRQLGYHDSGMTGSSTNGAAQAFWSQPIDSVVARIVELIREFRPQVVVTYDPFGCTGHPDHIQAHRVAVLAVEAAAEGHIFTEAGAAWMVSRLFYPVYPISSMRRFIDESLDHGQPHPMGGQAAEAINYTRPDDTVTHRVDIREVYASKRNALSQHRTQVGPHYPQMYRAALARRDYEHFRLVVDRPCSWDFDDLLEPVTP